FGDDGKKVTTIESLLSAVYEPHWRSMAMHLDIPNAPQVFGQLVADAGIEGIRYKSKYNGKPCLAIFPQNFIEPDSYVEIMGECPEGIKRRRLDASLNKKKE